MLLCDFHVHSNFSDGVLSIEELVDFYGTRNFDAISITDHICEESSFLGTAAHFLNKTLTQNSFPVYFEKLREQSERAWNQYKMILIPGFELTQNSFSNHRSSHILGIGVNDFIHPSGDALSLISQIKDQGAIAVAAHPVDTKMKEPQTYHLWNRREELRPHFDAWEVASGLQFFDEVKAEGLPLLASSDLHRPEQMSSWKTVVDSEKHPQAILEAIRKQRVKFRIYRDSQIQFVKSRLLPLNSKKSWAMDLSLIPIRF